MVPPALAQPAEGDGGPAEPAAAEPPRLTDFVEADYPPEAAAQGVEAEVVLRLDIGADGSVLEAVVTTPAGLGFDQAAQRAALGFRFAPARRAGVAVASRILYRYEFRWPQTEAPKTALGVAPPAQASDSTPPASPSARTEPAAASTAEVTSGSKVVVQGMTDAERRKRSAEAVKIVETTQARRQSADLGEVLARTQGISVRREGGLGSGTRFALNGLGDDRVRFFLDGIPLEFAGYPGGIANIPVNLVEHVEIYSGVVPVRFGADALGGAVNVVTDQKIFGQRLAGSYEVGSFDTHRLTLSYRNLHEPTGWFARLDGFVDHALNDYTVDVEVPDDSGQLVPATVRRFHDAYDAFGVAAEVGLVDRPYARRLLLRAFATRSEKEIQHNLVMSMPYGQVTFDETSQGASLRYQHSVGDSLSVGAVSGFVHEQSHFLDVGDCVYDWFGRCVRERVVPGETDTRPHDRLAVQNSAFARINLGLQLVREQALRLALAPTYVSRTGDELAYGDENSRDPATAERGLFTLINGLEYKVELPSARFENVLFIKQYFQSLNSDEPRPGGYVRVREHSTHHPGIGDGLRLGLADSTYAKVSYEWATTLPRPEQFFGDNAFVGANLDLTPERSHNLNAGVFLEAWPTRGGSFRGSLNGFLRDTSNLILLVGVERDQSFRNVAAARSLGAEAALGWTSPKELVTLDLNATYQDVRNTSTDGPYATFEGDRIPNLPWFFANGSARVAFADTLARRDELSLYLQTRYVHEFLRGWSALGRPDSKQTIPSQLIHTAGIGYLARDDDSSVSATLEVQNLTNEKAFDFWGAQRPGRAVFMKATAEL